jgi:hypothetical protein
MIKVTNVVTCVVMCYNHPDAPGNCEHIDIVVESFDRDTSHYWMKLTIDGKTYLVDTRDLIDACRNVQNGGAK